LPIGTKESSVLSEVAAVGGAECVECRIDYDDLPEDEGAFCPWCGARNPDCWEQLMWAELTAAEQAGALAEPPRRA
jgi:hypothetical protein